MIARCLASILFLLVLACRTLPPAPVAPAIPSETPAAVVAADGATAFVGVDLIPMTRDAGVVRNQTVIVRNGRITVVGPAASTDVPPGANVVAARGLYLIPGLADMHAHLEYFDSPAMLDLFTAAGVTFVRSMDGRPRILEWKKAIDNGALRGPAIYTAGPLLDGDPPVLPDNTVVRTAEEAREAVAQQVAAGYDFIKVYTALSSRAYDAILDEAKQRGLPVAGHVPRNSHIRKALASHASIEHLTDFDELIEASDSPTRGRWHWSKLYLAMSSDPAKIRSAASDVAAADVAIVPTLVQAEHALARPAMLETWLQRDELQAVPQEVRSHWESRVRGASERLDAEDWEIVERGRANRHALVRALHSAKATILAGTDTPNPFVVPGVSLHRELRLLVEAGLTPKAALAAATREAAAFVGQSDEWGTIEPGRRADLVLLEANPLQDITATTRIQAVMLRGTWVIAPDRERSR